MPGRVALQRSVHQQLPGAVKIALVHPAHRFRVILFLRRRPDGPPLPDPFELGAQPPSKRKVLTPEDFAKQYGADPADVERVTAFVKEHGLQVVDTSLESRTVTVDGTAASYTEAFAATLVHYAAPGMSYRTVEGQVTVPEHLENIVVGVVGLDDRPAATPAVAVHPGVFHPLQIANAQAAALAAAQKHIQEPLARVQALAAPAAPADKAAEKAEDECPAKRMMEAYAEWVKAYQEAQRVGMLAGMEALGVKTPPQVAKLYNFPEGTDGSGQTIAIMEMDGGYNRQELEWYFAFIGVPMPDITDISVGGATNSPGKSMGADSEVVLDISVAGGAAPGAKLVVYFTQNSPLGYIAAMLTAIHAPVNRPSIISTSWDQAESNWTQIPMIMGIFDLVLADAALLGITVCCSSGDYGAYGVPPSQFDGKLHVDFPGSNPLVLACGGTTLNSQGDSIASETAWNALDKSSNPQATGGGVSVHYPVPPWQQNVTIPASMNPGQGPGRGVPDVAGNADAATGYAIVFDGAMHVVGGTSAVSPLYAALFARINQSLGKNVGYITPFLYAKGAESNAFRDITEGNNGAYPAGAGWDACTGWGSPDGTKLRDLLGS